MEFTVVEGLRTFKFDLVFSLALAALVLFVGYLVQHRVPFLSRTNVPAAAVGGLLFAGLVFALRAWGVAGVTLDTSLRAPLQTAFFTTIGLGATLGLMRAGGWVPEQKITVEEAVRAYTVGAAYAEFAEGVKGTVTPGKLADLVILDRDIFNIDPAVIEQVRVRMTVMDGRVVYEKKP